MVLEGSSAILSSFSSSSSSSSSSVSSSDPPLELLSGGNRSVGACESVKAANDAASFTSTWVVLMTCWRRLNRPGGRFVAKTNPVIGSEL
jgi:cellulase/cellobiase CelA1